MKHIIAIFGFSVFFLAAIIYFARKTKRKEYTIIYEKDGFMILETSYYLGCSFSYRQHGSDEYNTLPFMYLADAKKALERIKKGKTKFKRFKSVDKSRQIP